MTLIACGGRDYANRLFVFTILDRIHAKRPISLLRHGAQTGADTLAGEWAISRSVPVDPVPAEWSKYRNAAGPIRNAAMLAKEPKPDGVVAFPGRHGTASMCKLAHAAGVKVWVPTKQGI